MFRVPFISILILVFVFYTSTRDRYDVEGSAGSGSGFSSGGREEERKLVVLGGDMKEERQMGYNRVSNRKKVLGGDGATRS